jgi:hypothetical protein
MVSAHHIGRPYEMGRTMPAGEASVQTAGAKRPGHCCPGQIQAPIEALSENKELAGLDETSYLEPVEIDTAAKARSIEPDFMVAGFLFSTGKSCDLLAESIENREKNQRPIGQPEANFGRRVEGVRVATEKTRFSRRGPREGL